MGKIRQTDTKNAVLIDIKTACDRYSLGINTMRKEAYAANAVVKIGNAVRVNVDKMDKHFGI